MASRYRQHYYKWIILAIIFFYVLVYNTSHFQHRSTKIKYQQRSSLNKTLDKILLVCHPFWRGVRIASEHLPFKIYYSEEYNSYARNHIKNHIKTANVTVLIISGIVPNYIQNLALLKSYGIKKIAFIYHGTAALLENSVFERTLFKQLHTSLDVDMIAYVKNGMASVLHGHYLPLITPQIFQSNTPIRQSIHIGVFMENMYIKNYHTQLLAACGVFNATIHTNTLPKDTFVPFNCRIIEYKDVDHLQLQEYLSQMHVNLYISLAESGSQIFWESLLKGRPCLTGNTIPIFNERLRQYLIVQDTTNLQEITSRIELVANMNFDNDIIEELHKQHVLAQEHLHRFIDKLYE